MRLTVRLTARNGESRCCLHPLQTIGEGKPLHTPFPSPKPLRGAQIGTRSAFQTHQHGPEAFVNKLTL